MRLLHSKLMKPTNIPSVCIIGRPNVGKSTLFNRIIGRRRAVVYKTSGTTRDRLEFLCDKGETPFRLIDTGGFMKTPHDNISSFVKDQIEKAIRESDLLLFVCDGISGIMPQDEELLSILRRADIKVFLVVNKVDNEKIKDGIYDFYKFGLGEAYPISAMHNLGIEKLVEDISDMVAKLPKSEAEEIAYKIAIVGKPNVGKSLFVNTLLKEERVIVSETPGTTRDSVDTYFKKDGKLFLLIDTAGIRHKRKIKEPVDVYSVMRSEESIKRSDVAFLLIDGYDGLRNDDVRIFNLILEHNKCCVMVVNKWDLVRSMAMADYKNAIIRKCPQAAFFPIVFASAKTGRNLLSCIDMTKYVLANSDQTIPTKELNRLFLKNSRFLAVFDKKGLKVRYIVQVSKRPPEFLFFVNDTKLVTDEYFNFIENSLRKNYNLYGTPIKMSYRRK